MSRIIIKRGRASIEIEGPSGVELELAVRRVLGTALDEVEAEVLAIKAEHIDRDWPVKTGRSKEAWETALRIDPTRMRAEVVLVNRFTYVRYIKSTKKLRFKDRTRLRAPLQTEVRKPLRVSGRELARRLKPLLDRALVEEIRHG